MSVEDLRREVTEYSLRIEEVLSGMDGVLTDLRNRVAILEQKMATPVPPSATTQELLHRVESIEEQVTTLGLSITDLLSGRDS